MNDSGKVLPESAGPCGCVDRTIRSAQLIFTVIIALCSSPLAFGQTTDSSGVWLPYVLTEDGVLPTYGASVVIDSNGGVHAAYAIFSGSDQGLRLAIYAFCPGDCADKANWTFTRLGEVVHDVRIALNPDGLEG